MTSSPSRLIRAVVVSTCLAFAGLVGAQSGAAAVKTYSCSDISVNKTPAGLYGGYLTGISVKGSYSSRSRACKAANSVVFAYYKCRRAKGVKGSCSGRTIKGLRCKESHRSIDKMADQLNADVTCSKGSKRVKHHYQQNLHKQ